MSKSVTMRLDESLVTWVDEYAGERGVSRTTIHEAALASFREDCSKGTPHLPEPEVRLKPGECPVVEVRGPGIRQECPTYGKPVEPPGDSKFVCPRGDCGWVGASKIELCPQHGRWAVPRGSSARRIIVDVFKWGERTREDFARLTAMRAEAFAKAKMPAGTVIGGSSQGREDSNRARQAVLNKSKGMEG